LDKKKPYQSVEQTGLRRKSEISKELKSLVSFKHLLMTFSLQIYDPAKEIKSNLFENHTLSMFIQKEPKYHKKNMTMVFSYI